MMDHAITVGDLLTALAWLAVSALVIGAAIGAWFLWEARG